MRKCLLCWLALAACFPFLFSASVCAGGISIDGYVQPGEWDGAPFSTLFTSEQESGCAVSYADLRMSAEVPSRRIYFAFQVIDGAFTGRDSLSRVHLRLGNAEIALAADGSFQASGNTGAVRAVGRYQEGGYNCDYVLEAQITLPAPFSGEKFPVSVWFTDGKGVKSRVCEVTVDLGLPLPSAPASVPPQPDSTATQQLPSTAAPPIEKPPTTQSGTHAGTTRTTKPAGPTAAVWPEPGTKGQFGQYVEPSSPAKSGQDAQAHPNAYPDAGALSPEGPISTNASGEEALPPQEVTIPATGESRARAWSVKRIVACAMAGACVLAAALLFVSQMHKKEKNEPSEG